VTDGSAGLPAIGADGLRLWVALSAADTTAEARISKEIAEEIGRKVAEIRRLFRFILGSLDGYRGDCDNRRELRILDRVKTYRLLVYLTWEC